MGTHHPIRKTVTPEPAVIPDKLYFRIGDVATICGVAAYVLRFWETEFPQLKPNKGGTGQRLYRKRDVEMALRIKSLLYDQGYTIPGARQILKSDPRGTTAFPPPEQTTATGPELAPAASNPSTNLGVPGPALSAAERVASDTRVFVPPQKPAATARLTALRDEMRSLLATLSEPASAIAGKPTAVPMRPRLVLEPKPAAPTALKPEKPRLQIAQRDLFGGFDPDDTPRAG